MNWLYDYTRVRGLNVQYQTWVDPAPVSFGPQTHYQGGRTVEFTIDDPNLWRYDDRPGAIPFRTPVEPLRLILSGREIDDYLSSRAGAERLFKEFVARIDRWKRYGNEQTQQDQRETIAKLGNLKVDPSVLERNEQELAENYIV